MNPQSTGGPNPERHIDLSIVIVNWNTRKMTRECLASVSSGLGDLAAEILVVDNASTDGSADMVEADFPEVALIRNSENRGFAAANNQGFNMARGKHVLLLNTDTLVHGNALPASVVWLNAHPDVGAMGCRVLNTDGSVQLTCSMYPSVLNQILQLSGLSKLRHPRFFGRHSMTHWLRDSEREVEVISGCYLLVRRSVIDQIGLLDENFFFFGEETDWCKRMRDAGWRLMFAPVGEITHHGSVSARKLDYHRDVLLSESIVRLHRKHAGVFGGLVTFGIISMFNATRALYWSFAAVFSSSEHARARGKHFRAVLKVTSRVWPKSERAAK
ncbi:hypothetical protein SAMN05444414_12542 [Roseovarius marisflavi]|uniref:Glycosyltransferase 2-like domain-containing protein n=1 Tax=Roseovarius marisflavi TaxID=1054996 RepID=A0A1M7CIU1_9RHOB|nr:glycosyltransferase family 2 protein [Roseovarius marisflavi]SHL66719.1 hypothetical protein SAMN05444414_12542 [Roseovarius marisflavi]